MNLAPASALSWRYLSKAMRAVRGMEASSRPMKNIRKWPEEIMKYMPSSVKSTSEWNSPDLMRFSLRPNHEEAMRKTMMTPTLRTLLMMVITGVWLYMPPKASVMQASEPHHGSRLAAVWMSMRTTGSMVRSDMPDAQAQVPSGQISPRSSLPQRKRSARNTMRMTARRLSSSCINRNCE